MTQSTPNERLKRAREQAGFASMREACDRFGWPYETYKKHEGNRPIDPDMAPDYGRKFGVDPGWILWGINPPSWDETSQLIRLRGNLRSVPKLTPEQAVHIPHMFHKYRKSAPETPVDDGQDIGPKSFSTDVQDDSMTAVGQPDSFAAGDEIVVDPDRETKTGDYVLAHVEGEPKAIFRKLRMRGTQRGEPLYELAALNPDYGATPVGTGGQRFRIIGKMIRHIKKYA